MTGADLRAWREARGLSVKACAVVLAAAPDTIKSWETGRRPVGDYVALLIAAIALRDAARQVLGARAGSLQRTPYGVLPAPHDLVAGHALAELEAALAAMR
jgi:transcriptional regulator with XRE-family HTH domain